MPPQPRSLHGKVAVVTGGGRGIGKALALALTRAGCRVAIGDVDGPAAALAAEEAGSGAIGMALDVTDRQGFTAFLDDVERRLGALDILVNNAGIIRRADAVDFSEADWDDVIDVNLKAVFFLSQAFARTTFARGTGGAIVNIASLLAFQGGIRIPSYTASKSGLAGLTRLLACEWAPKGINVNAIAPGYFVTNNTQALRADAKRSGEILSRIPAGRWGDPPDIGGAAVFLASPAADYVHGIVLPVDGGWLAR
jgi:2-dehydro-3-deoxy-D-gluconate 5-dehydrogenase